MDITISISERDFEACLTLASALNISAGHDIRRFHSVLGVAAVALHLGLERMAPLFGVALASTSSEADALARAVEKELRRRHYSRELLTQPGEAA